MINSSMKKYFFVFVSSALMANNVNASPEIYIKGETGALLRYKPYSGTHIKTKSVFSVGIKKPIDENKLYDIAFKVQRTYFENIDHIHIAYLCNAPNPEESAVSRGLRELCSSNHMPIKKKIKTKTDIKTTHHIPATIYKTLPYDVTAGFGTDLSRIKDGFHLKVKRAFDLNNQWRLKYGYTYQRLQKSDDRHTLEAKLNSKRLGLGASATMTSGNDQLTSIYLEHEISNLTIGIKSEFKEGVQEHNSLYFAFSL